MTKEKQTLEDAAMQASYEITGGATIDLATDEETKELPYLNREMLTDGSARNVVTVKITTPNKSFIVDVLKVNAMHRIYKSKNKTRLIELSQNSLEDGLTDELLDLNYIENREILQDYIMNPQISLKRGVKDSIHIDELPEDIQDLLLGAYEKVNNPRGVAREVQRFPETSTEE